MEIHSALTSQRLGRMETQLHSHSDPIHLTQGITGVPQPARAPLAPLLISRSSQTPGAGLPSQSAQSGHCPCALLPTLLVPEGSVPAPQALSCLTPQQTGMPASYFLSCQGSSME